MMSSAERTEITFHAKWVHRLFIAFSVGTFCVTYPVALWGCKHDKNCMTKTEKFYLSNSLNYAYASNIGASLLFPAVICLVAALTIKRFDQMEWLQRTQPDDDASPRAGPRVDSVSKFAWVCSFFAAAGGMMVCCWPIHAEGTVHDVSASLFFTGAGVSLTCFTYVDYQLEQRRSAPFDKLLALRIGALTMAYVMAGAEIVSVTVLDPHTWSGKIVGAGCEIMIYVFFELCFLTYAPLFDARSFTIGSAPLRAEETGDCENNDMACSVNRAGTQSVQSVPLLADNED